MTTRSRAAFRLFFVALLALPAGSLALRPDPPSTEAALDGFDLFVAEKQKAWQAPGVAVAVVKDGRVVLAKGYGQRDREKGLPVTTRTLFAIGSVTKSFTVATLGALVTQGKLKWDEPVRDVLPDFRLYDETAERHMTPRDLVTHRSGLPRHDSSWYNAEATRKELYQRLRHLEPSKDFRTTFQYNNFMFMTAGYLAGELSGGTWEESVRKNIFEPLGMTGSNFSTIDSQKSADHAIPYELDDDDRVQKSTFRELPEMGPAGSINSNIEDMTRYLLLQLNKGRHEGKQVIAEADVAQMHAPQMVLPSPIIFPEIGHTTYGMGFFVTSYRGHKLVHHGGNIDGFSAFLSFLPNDGIGAVVLTNMNGSALPTVLTYQVYDRLLGLEPVDWSARYKERQAKGKASEEEAKKKGYTPKKKGTRPSHAIAEYVGEFEHPGYGRARVERAGAGEDLKLTYNRFTSTLKHFHYDVWEVPPNKLDRLERTKVMFLTDWNGDVSSLSVPMETGVKDIVFHRIADASLKDPKVLEPYAGNYELGPNTVAVTLRGDGVLVLTIPGQSPYDLVPVRAGRFDLKGLSGYSVEFKKDGSGRVGELVVFQPDASYVARRKAA